MQKGEVVVIAAVTVGKSAKVVCGSFSPKFFFIFKSRVNMAAS